jgi:hypothetical protein
MLKVKVAKPERIDRYQSVSTNAFSEALRALVVPQAEGLSASTTTRLKAV